MNPRALRSEIWLPKPLEDIFAFFSDVRNLQTLTPNWLDFSILTPMPIPMRPGAVIDYRLRLHGFPIRWRSEISSLLTPLDGPHFTRVATGDPKGGPARRRESRGNRGNAGSHPFPSP